MFARFWGLASRTVASTVLVVVAVVLQVIFVFGGTLMMAGSARALTTTGSVGDVIALVVVIITLAELGFVAVAGVFLLAAKNRHKYVRVALPDGRDWRYVVGGTVLSYVIALTATVASWVFDGGTGTFSTGELGSSSEVGSSGNLAATTELSAGSIEVILLTLVVLSILVIGPSEELLFRGVVQRYLGGVASQASAIVVSSILFTVVHAPTFLMAASGPTGIFAAMTIFGISLTLGYSYAVTDNFLVPTVVHGVYDATLFGVVFVAFRAGVL